MKPAAIVSLLLLSFIFSSAQDYHFENFVSNFKADLEYQGHVREMIRTGNAKWFEEEFESIIFTHFFHPSYGFKVLLRECYLQGNYELAEDMLLLKSPLFRRLVFQESGSDLLFQRPSLWPGAVFTTLFSRFDIHSLASLLRHLKESFVGNPDIVGIQQGEWKMSQHDFASIICRRGCFGSVPNLLASSETLFNDRERMAIATIIESVKEIAYSKGGKDRDRLIQDIYNGCFGLFDYDLPDEKATLLSLLVFQVSFDFDTLVNDFFYNALESCRMDVLLQLESILGGHDKIFEILHSWGPESIGEALLKGTCYDTFDWLSSSYNIAGDMVSFSRFDLRKLQRKLNPRWKFQKKTILDAIGSTIPYFESLFSEQHFDLRNDDTTEALMYEPVTLFLAQRFGNLPLFSETSNRYVFNFMMNLAFEERDMKEVERLKSIDTPSAAASFFLFSVSIDWKSVLPDEIDSLMLFMIGVMEKMIDSFSVDDKYSILLASSQANQHDDSLIVMCMKWGVWGCADRIMAILKSDDELMDLFFEDEFHFIIALLDAHDVAPAAGLAFYRNMMKVDGLDMNVFLPYLTQSQEILHFVSDLDIDMVSDRMFCHLAASVDLSVFAILMMEEGKFRNRLFLDDRVIQSFEHDTDRVLLLFGIILRDPPPQIPTILIRLINRKKLSGRFGRSLLQVFQYSYLWMKDMSILLHEWLKPGEIKRLYSENRRFYSPELFVFPRLMRWAGLLLYPTTRLTWDAIESNLNADIAFISMIKMYRLSYKELVGIRTAWKHCTDYLFIPCGFGKIQDSLLSSFNKKRNFVKIN